MKAVIVTGASSGIGRELAIRLAETEQPEELWIVARSAQALAQLRGAVCCKVRVLALDLTQEQSLTAFRALLEEQVPDVRLLVNCAGFGKFGSYSQIKTETSLNMIDLNIKALVAVTEMTLPYMRSGSRIVEVSSLSAFQPLPYLNVYAATKAFVLSYARALNRELRPRGIRVLAVCPYWVNTPFFDRAAQTNDRALKKLDKIYSVAETVDGICKELYRGKKDVCIPGAYAKLLHAASKLLPHRLVMDVWMKQQKLNQ